MSGSLFEPGRNCWRVAHAERFRCVQDGAEYFRLVREAILAARHTVFILGWDIAGGVDLLPGEPHAVEPTKLSELLAFVARRRRALRCYVLIWDYAAFYAVQRDPLSRLRLGWGTPRRVRFRFDGQHPWGACHHQKLVVVDDRLAFVGGIDLTGHRWDTTAHDPENPLRVNLLGIPYAPYHEIQAMVEGAVAADLGELARERWRRHGRVRLPPVAPGVASNVASSVAPTAAAAGESLWPADLPPDLTDVDVAIARTEPGFGGRPAVRECEALYFDMIAAARERLYIENQYFTNARIGDALAARLREEHGPELVVVGPKDCEGWLERRTMGALRGRVLGRLAAADRHGRLCSAYPVASKAKDVCTFVHSKLMIADDEILRIGSANLSGRSMGFDTECDLAVAAGGEARLREGIARVRARLLAEHLGAEPAQVERALESDGSLCALIDRLGQGDRSLVRFEVAAAAEDEPGALAIAADPEEPARISRAIERVLPEIDVPEGRSRLLRRALPLGALLAALLVGWRTAELGHWLTLAGIQEYLALAPGSERILLAALGLFVAGGLLFVPLELLVLASATSFGPWQGALLAVLGVAGSSALGYLLGRSLGSRRLAGAVGRRSERLWRLLQGRGFLTVAMLRLLSSASDTAIHLLCGAARIPVRDYAVGTLLALAPVLLVFGPLAALLRRLLLHPGPKLALLTVAAAGLAILVALRLRTSLLRRQAHRGEHEQRALFG